MRDDSMLLAPAENPDVVFLRERMGVHLPLLASASHGEMGVLPHAPNEAIMLFYSSNPLEREDVPLFEFRIHLPVPWTWNAEALYTVGDGISDAIAALSRQQHIHLDMYYNESAFVTEGVELVCGLRDLQFDVLIGGRVAEYPR